MVPSGRESNVGAEVLAGFYKGRNKEDVYQDIKNHPHLKKQFDAHTTEAVQLMKEVSACIIQMSMSSFGGMCVCVFAGLLTFLFVCDSLSVCWPVCTACFCLSVGAALCLPVSMSLGISQTHTKHAAQHQNRLLQHCANNLAQTILACPPTHPHS